MRTAVPGVLAASRRRTAAPSILGHNVSTNPSGSSGASGRIYMSLFTLASSATLTELHGWFQQTGTAVNMRLVIYADSAGSPGARVAYTSPIALGTGSAIVELSEAGFSVALTAGSYWLGFRSSASGGSVRGESTGGTHKGKSTGAADPPPDPFGSTDASGTRKHAIWAVIT